MLSSIKIFLAFTTTLLILFTNLSCHRTPIEPEKTKVNLIYEDALCTEAYFRLKTTEINYPARVDLYLNKDKVNSFTTFSDDTVFVIENLLPKKSYTSYVRVYPEGGRELVSSEVSFVTMDTTSHDFTWQVFEFGDLGNSILYDVAIIDENNIWAVGEIRVYDTLGRGVKYNAVHWDGSKWELKRIPSIICGLNSIIYSAIYTIYALNENNIFFSDGGEIIHYNGQRFKQDCSINPLLTGAINKLWGTSSNDLYAVGDKGNIAHWDGRRWTKIESGTDLDINDIYGVFDTSKKEANIFCVASNVLQSPDRKIFKIEGQLIKEIPSNGIYWGLSSIWFTKKLNFVITTGGGGIYYTKLTNENIFWKLFSNVPSNYFCDRVRGNNYNDIVVCGSFGELLHFNGLEWKSYLNKELPFFYGRYRSLDIKRNVVCAVGDFSQGYNSKGIIIIGIRNQ